MRWVKPVRSQISIFFHFSTWIYYIIRYLKENYKETVGGLNFCPRSSFFPGLSVGVLCQVAVLGRREPLRLGCGGVHWLIYAYKPTSECLPLIYVAGELTFLRPLNSSVSLCGANFENLDLGIPRESRYNNFENLYYVWVSDS